MGDDCDFRPTRDDKRRRRKRACVPDDRLTRSLRGASVSAHLRRHSDAGPRVQQGLAIFTPEQLNSDVAPLINWLAGSGCSKVAIHFDVDCIDSNEIVLGLGAEPGGLTQKTVGTLFSSLTRAADVVGVTVAEFIPRQVIALQALLRRVPLLCGLPDD